MNLPQNIFNVFSLNAMHVNDYVKVKEILKETFASQAKY